MAGVDFKSIARAVRSATYGRDMRKAIADGFDGVGDLQANVVTDKTLLKSDMAADSKVVGDKFKEVGDKFKEIEEAIDSIIPGLTIQEKDLLLAYFSEQVELHPELQESYNAILNLWKPPVASVSFANDSETIAVNMSIVLEPIILPENAQDKTGTWSVNPSFGIVRCDNGKVTGVSVGTATVTFTSNSGNKSASVIIEVVDTPYYTITKTLTNVQLSNLNEGVMAGDAYYATLIPDDDYVITDVDILMGSKNITEEAYNSIDHTITIVSVTDNVTIIATAREHAYYSIKNNLTNCISSSSVNEVVEGAVYSSTITRTDENKLLDYRVMMGDSDITDDVASTNDDYKSIKILIPKVTGNVTITVASIDPTNLENISWNAVSRISKAGLATQYFEIGDTKSIVLNGTMRGVSFNNLSIDLYIIGINHNASKEGANLIHFKLGKINGVQVALINRADYDDQEGGTFCMNASGLSKDGWGTTTMRTSILGNDKDPIHQTAGTFISLLPEDLRSVMRTATKYSYQGSAVAAVTDYASLLSEVEYIGRSLGGHKEELIDNVQYSYYASGNPIYHYPQDDQGQDVYTWTRSVGVREKPQYFTAINTKDSLVNADVTYRDPKVSVGVAPVIYV